MPIRDEITKHYDGGVENVRFNHPAGNVEFVRSQQIISRYLPKSRAKVLDVGGGPGNYSRWLLSLGHEVHLIDPVAGHVEQAREAFRAAGATAEWATQGIGGDLKFEDNSFDVVLVMGPLYHLTEREDRLQTLREAQRVLRPGGVVVAAAISRFASLFDGLFRRLIDDPAFMPILEADLKTGQHRNPTDNPEYFTTAFFHQPEELRDEASAAHLQDVKIVAVEGPVWLMPDLEQRWNDADRCGQLLSLIEAVETEPAILGVSAHWLAIGRKAG